MQSNKPEEGKKELLFEGRAIILRGKREREKKDGEMRRGKTSNRLIGTSSSFPSFYLSCSVLLSFLFWKIMRVDCQEKESESSFSFVWWMRNRAREGWGRMKSLFLSAFILSFLCSFILFSILSLILWFVWFPSTSASVTKIDRRLFVWHILLLLLLTVTLPSSSFPPSVRRRPVVLKQDLERNASEREECKWEKENWEKKVSKRERERKKREF